MTVVCWKAVELSFICFVSQFTLDYPSVLQSEMDKKVVPHSHTFYFVSTLLFPSVFVWQTKNLHLIALWCYFEVILLTVSLDFLILEVCFCFTRSIHLILTYVD